jgi:hypothetical protein
MIVSPHSGRLFLLGAHRPQTPIYKLKYPFFNLRKGTFLFLNIIHYSLLITHCRRKATKPPAKKSTYKKGGGGDSHRRDKIAEKQVLGQVYCTLFIIQT